LIEVLTGEGKSVVLGVVATYFALLGFEVNCICYSKYLSKRDYSDFKNVFETFKVQDKVKYSTISKMCDVLINTKGNVRDLTKEAINSVAQNQVNSSFQESQNLSKGTKRLLLIDEVDVFFGADFYGNTYNPATLISNDKTFVILKFIYMARNNITFESVIRTSEYMELVQTFSKLKGLIDFEIQKMIKDVKDFENTPEKPRVSNGKIYYKQQDRMTCKKVYGYKTAFQYFESYTKGEIQSEQQVKENVGLFIGCGNFSFAEIPKDFDYIMGVSGTLQSLTKEEKDIIQGYKIERLAFAPSIYGGSRLNESSDRVSSILLVQDQSNWFLRIKQHCQGQQQKGRGVLIFFEDDAILRHFEKNSKNELPSLQILDENEKFKETIIKQASSKGTVTLCTRSFARGVDFICLDPETKGNGGVHVIQTFVSDSEAEQIQLKGRTARQGDPGSHEYILCYVDLNKYFGTKEGDPPNSGFDSFDEDQKLTRSDLEKKMNRLRDQLYQQRVSELETKRQQVMDAHRETAKFHDLLVNYDGTPQSKDQIMDALMKLNEACLSKAVSKYHLFFCLDESGSMSGQPWKDLILAVTAFITKRIEMCEANSCVPLDLVTIVNYGSAGRVIFQDEKISNLKQVDLYSRIPFADTGTNFAAGLKEVMKCIGQTKFSEYTPCLIFMSDGGCGNGEKEMEEIQTLYGPNKLQVFVVGFSSGCDRSKMTKLATLGGGQFFFGSDGAELKAQFQDISVKISGGEMAL